MLDLAKPLGIHQGLIFYGDHEHSDLVYYFPDEISLAPQTDAFGNKLDVYELFLQIFFEGGVVEGGIESLRETAGSILSLGAQCSVSSSRLEQAVQELKNTLLLDNLRASTPFWSDGNVNLIVLDSTTTDKESLNKESFVKSIIGSNKPSLMSTNLKSIFNVRLDRRGTALVNAALEGGTGNVAGILYDLKYAAIRPAVDLKIWADLGRCYDSISHSLGVKVEFTYYVKFSLGAEFEWLTKQLEENGDLKIEVLSQVEDVETKKMIDEMVKDFKESILRELFRPYVNPQTDTIMNMESLVPVVGVSYKFKKEKITQNKIIEVDYRERSTVIRTHNPQSHLWVFGKQIETNKDLYIQKIAFNEIWREHELSIKLLHDFMDKEQDLLSVEVVIWRRKIGLKKELSSGKFSIPDGASSLKSFTFHQDNIDEEKISWLYDRGEELGYYYQLRFLYSNKIENISSPSEIMTDAVSSTSQDLIIFPDTYTFFKTIQVTAGNISFDEFKSIDISLSLLNSEAMVLGHETITLSNDNKSEIWTVRGKDKDELFVQIKKVFHFIDDRPSIEEAARIIIDDEVIVNKPFQITSLRLIPVIAGKAENVKEILLEIAVISDAFEKPIKKLYRIKGPEFELDDIEIKLQTDKDQINYACKVILDDGKIILLSEGVITDNALVIDLNKVNKRDINFIWQGPSPLESELKHLTIELESRNEAGINTPLESIIYKGENQPISISISINLTEKLFMRISRKFINGSSIKEDWVELVNVDNVIKGV